MSGKGPRSLRPDFFGGHGTRQGQHRDQHKETTKEHGSTKREIPEDRVSAEASEGTAAQLSGNSVELSSELMKEGLIKRDYDLNTAVVKAFNKMMLMAVRKG